MNLKEIKQVINSDLPDEMTEYLIIHILAKDESVVPSIIEILGAEREEKKKLIEEMNLQLSRAETGLSTPKINRDHFIEKEIKEFYAKYQNQVKHCFKNYGKLEPKKDEGFS